MICDDTDITEIGLSDALLRRLDELCVLTVGDAVDVVEYLGDDEWNELHEVIHDGKA